MTFVRQWLVLLIGMAFLNASAVGAHLHLCLDGQEPPQSLHVLDGQHGIHHVDSSQSHNDIDISLTDGALTKVFKFNPSAFALPAVWTLPPVSLVASGSRVVHPVRGAQSICRFLLPPLRGPPV